MKLHGISLMDTLAGPTAGKKVVAKAAGEDEEKKAAEATDDVEAKDEKAEGADKSKVEDDDDEKMLASPAAIAQACTDAGVPHMVSELIRKNVTVAELKAKTDVVGQIRHMVTLARKINPTIGMKLADDFIQNRASGCRGRRDAS